MTKEEHFQNAHRCAELIASGQTPLFKAHLINALIQSLKKALHG